MPVPRALAGLNYIRCGVPGIPGVPDVSVTVSIKVRRELVELADRMVRYGLARSRSHAFNLMIERGLEAVVREVGFWDQVYREVEELARRGVRLRHGGLGRLLEEGRAR